MSEAVNILLPVKSLATCKQRLAPLLPLARRQALVSELLRRTLHVLGEHFAAHHRLVITPDPVIARIAKACGASVLMERKARGLNQALQAGTRWSLAKGYRRQLVLAPDIGQLEVTELKQLFDDGQALFEDAGGVLISEAKDGGTNALFTQPPSAITFAFGQDSARCMQRQATQRGWRCRVMRLAHMQLDIDQPQDWLRWQAGLGNAAPLMSLVPLPPPAPLTALRSAVLSTPCPALGLKA